MSLIAKVQADVSSARLKPLTNDGDTDASAVDTTILQAATDAIEQEFQFYSRTTYDTDKGLHNDICIDGVMARLHMNIRQVSEFATETYAFFVERCKELLDSSPPAPKTTSTLTIIREEAREPRFVHRKWNDFRAK